MAGGPIFPFSVRPVTSGLTFPYFHGSGSSTETLGVEASVGADSIWRLRFQLPPAIPTGTLKLLQSAFANATSGNAKVNVKWNKATAGDDVDAVTPTAEGVQTITWAAGEAYDRKDTKLTLDAVTVGAGDENKWIVMDVTFETASWTLAQISGWVFSIIWE